MVSGAVQTGIRFGLKKGYPVEKTEARAAKTAIKTRPSRSHGRVHPGPEGKAGKKRRSSKKVDVVREVIRDVAGLAPYEKRVLDIIKTGGANAEKRSYKFAKGRLGTHKRAIAKRKEIQAYYGKQRARGAA